MLDCILTGPGAEYGGSRSFSASKRKCKSWNKKYKLDNIKVRKLNIIIMQIIAKNVHLHKHLFFIFFNIC